MFNNRAFWLSSKLPDNIMLRIILNLLSTESVSKVISTLISVKSHPFRLAYMRKVIPVQEAREAASNSFGEKPKSFPPLLSGSSETIKFVSDRISVLYNSLPVCAVILLVIGTVYFAQEGEQIRFLQELFQIFGPTIFLLHFQSVLCLMLQNSNR